MKKYRIKHRSLVLVSIRLLVIGCRTFSKWVWDESVGMNGSFEIVKNGLPVNWLIYAPETIPTGKYTLNIDSIDFKDGRQSLRFMVNECSSQGGWNSPGLTNQYFTNPGDTYKVSFWVKNSGSRFRMIVGGVTAFDGKYETIVNSDEKINEWRLYEFFYTMPDRDGWDNIRIELNILEPGIFWIDDFKIEDKNGKLLKVLAN